MRRLAVWTLLLMVSLPGVAWSAAAGSGAPLWHRSVSIQIQVRPDGTADSVESWDVRGETMAVAHILAQQSFGFIADLEQVGLLEASTIKPDGRRIGVQPDAVMAEAVTTQASAPQFSALESRSILFPDVQAGDAVHYVLRRHGIAALFPGAFTTTLRLGTWSYTERAEVSIALPPGMRLAVAASGLEEAAPELLADGGMVRRWRLATAEGEAAKGGAAAGGSVMLDVSSFADYPALGRAYAERALPRSRPGPAVQALAASLTEGVAGKREQALRLYRYVATQIRYVANFLGDGRVVPRDSAQVLAEGFGDCKDHTALLTALLAARGIEAVPALISLRNLYTLPVAPGLGALNHVITYVPALALYLDSTAPYAPFGLLPASEYDKPVVLAEAGAARLARTPALPPSPLELTTTTQAKIDADDAISGTTTTEASGPQSIALRSMAAWIEGRGPSGAASLQLRQLGTPGSGGFSFEPPEQDGPEYQVKAQFTLDEPLIDGGEAPFPLPGGLGVFERPGRLLLGEGATEEGGHVCYPGREVEQVSLALPKGAEVTSLPQGVSAEGGGARYVSTYAVEDGAIRVRREFTVASARVYCSADDYAAMRGVVNAARRDQRAQIALSRVD